MNKTKALLDINLFKRLLRYVLVYKSVFVFVAISAVLISLFSTLTPYLIKIAVDDYLAVSNFKDFIFKSCNIEKTLFISISSMFIFEKKMIDFFIANKIDINL